MNSKDFKSSRLSECWYDNMPSPNQFNVGQSSGNNVGWSFEENRLFAHALAEQVEVVGSLAFYQSLATKFPYRSMQDIMMHFEALVKDFEMIESDNIPAPEYDAQEDTRTLIDDLEEEEETDDTNERRSPSVESRRTSTIQHRRGIPWTKEEHQLFLMGLNKYGKGDWRSISRYYVTSKTPTQIASHAQKYFKRQISTTPMDRRRPSIHDIQTVANVAHPGTNMSLPTFNSFTINSSSAPQMSFQSERTTYLMNNSISGISTNLEPSPAMFVPGGHFNSTTSLMNNSFSGVGTNFEHTPAMFVPDSHFNSTASLMNNPMFVPNGHFNATASPMNNSVSGVVTNVEQTPAMFAPDSHMPSSSMNNQHWG